MKKNETFDLEKNGTFIDFSEPNSTYRVKFKPQKNIFAKKNKNYRAINSQIGLTIFLFCNIFPYVFAVLYRPLSIELRKKPATVTHVVCFVIIYNSHRVPAVIIFI